LFHVFQQDHGTSSMHTYLTPMKHNSAQDLIERPVVQKQCFFVLIYTPFSPWKPEKEYLQMQYCIWVVSCHACVQMQTAYIAGLSTHVFTKDVIMKQFRGTHTFLLICIIIPLWDPNTCSGSLQTKALLVKCALSVRIYPKQQ